MDTVKILTALLKSNALGSKKGGNILGTLLGGNSSAGKSGDLLSALLGGKSRSSKGGMGALAAILAVAAATKGAKGSSGGSSDLLGSILSQVAGGGGKSSSKSGGALGDLLGSALGGGASKASSGGLGDLVGGLLGGGTKKAASGGLGDLLGSVLGAAGGGGPLGIADLSALPEVDPVAVENEARILVEAMCLAARADGVVDDEEREKIFGSLGELDAEEHNFLQSCLSSGASLDDFVKRVPKEMAEQVYAFSLMAVTIDTQEERDYFVQLAKGLGLDQETVNTLHAGLE